MKHLKQVSILLILLGVISLNNVFSQKRNSSLVAYYNFNQNVKDNSTYNNDGVVYGNPVYVEGIQGFGLDFDGVDDYVLIPNQDQLSLSDFSISVWVKWEGEPDAEGSWAIISNWTFGEYSQQYGLRMGTISTGLTENHGVFFYDDGSEWDWAYGIRNNISNNEWHNIIGVMKAGESAKVFIDGFLFETDSTSIPNIINPTSDLFIGRDGYGESGGQVERWNGVIDELRIYNCTLDYTEMNLNYETTLALYQGANVMINSDIDCTLYPNPTTNIVKIKVNNKDVFNVRVLDINGKLIINKDYNSNFSEVDLTSFAKGIYLFRISSDSYTKTFKVTKSN